MRRFDPCTVDQCLCLYLQSVLACLHLFALMSVLAQRVFLWIPRYFPASSTQEMLDEWRPLLCVFDVVMQKAISNMELFLPTIMPPEEHSQGFR